MNRRKSIRKICAAAAAALCLSVAALPTAVRADALIEEFWFTMYNVDYYVVVDAPDGGVSLRYGAGTEYSTVLDGLIPNGTVLHIQAEARATNGKYWGATEYDGWSGFIFLGHTKKTAPPAETAAAQDPAVPEQTTAAPKTAGAETAGAETAALETAAAETNTAAETSAAAETSTAAETSAAGEDWLNGLLGMLHSLFSGF